jgi:hypothetical protein
MSESSADVCVFCAAAGCISGTAVHEQTCPFVSGMWPVDQDMLDRDNCCAACEDPFKKGDLYALATDETHPAMWKPVELAEALGQDDMLIRFVVCLPCAAVDADLAR